MQVMLLHPRFKTKTITLGPRHLMLAALALVVLVVTAASLLYHLAMRHGVQSKPSILDNPAATATREDASKKDRYIKENLAAMAVKLGEMQAQLLRLDALGERVQGLAGVKPQEFNFRESPGRGGIASGREGLLLDMDEFRQALDGLARDVEHRADYSNVVETTLMSQKIRSKLLPTIQPVNVGYNASGFGWRLDPFTGRTAFHEGIDFASPAGTPIIAAAGGVVIAAEYHPQYGNLLDIDHGNDIVTRYAHASRLLKRVGDIVKRGQHVADIGSTGRSTSAHLHFEVIVKGVQQDPHKFLSAGASSKPELLTI